MHIDKICENLLQCSTSNDCRSKLKKLLKVVRNVSFGVHAKNMIKIVNQNVFID